MSPIAQPTYEPAGSPIRMRMMRMSTAGWKHYVSPKRVFSFSKREYTKSVIDHFEQWIQKNNGTLDQVDRMTVYYSGPFSNQEVESFFREHFENQVAVQQFIATEWQGGGAPLEVHAIMRVSK